MASWLADQLKAYQAQTGVNVTATLKEAQSVLADFRQAAETGSPPDAQSFWSGRGLYDSIWREHLADLESLFPQDFLARNAAVLSAFEGHTYRVGWYALPLTWMYNKALFKQAGLDPAKPPSDWDTFLSAARRLKAASITPLGAGLSDGYCFEAFCYGPVHMAAIQGAKADIFGGISIQLIRPLSVQTIRPVTCDPFFQNQFHLEKKGKVQHNLDNSMLDIGRNSQSSVNEEQHHPCGSD